MNNLSFLPSFLYILYIDNCPQQKTLQIYPFVREKHMFFVGKDSGTKAPESFHNIIDYTLRIKPQAIFCPESPDGWEWASSGRE